MIPQKIAPNIFQINPEMKIVKVDEQMIKFDMHVPARIYANESLMQRIVKDQSIDQVTNVACLPGIQKWSIAMADAHQGYGFPIGGVAATDINGGAISPGGVGYDINCGVRLLSTGLEYSQISNKLEELTSSLFHNIPSGLGSEGKLKITPRDLDQILNEGVNWAINHGFGFQHDREVCEDLGMMEGADADLISKKSKNRGISEIGSLGSGNHFLEIQRVDKVYDPEAAKVMGIEENQVTVMIHTGSRAVGHQVCTESLQEIDHLMHRNNVIPPDRELAYVESGTKEADRYLAQMRAAANFAFNNRHIIMHWTRECFQQVLKIDPSEMKLIYDVVHNILKIEEHDVGNGKRMKVNVHRKGATRAFPAGHPSLPSKYQSIGQPVLIPGSMGTASYLCVGLPKAMELSFASTAHGSGREMSRTAAKKHFWGKEIKSELNARGIAIQAASISVIAEEAPLAYKNIDQVVNVSHELGIVKKVARFVPIGVTKG